MIDRAWVRACLTGPVSSIRTPFLKDGAIDFEGLRRAIDFNIAAGSRTMLLTAGDSHYFALSDDEIAEVTRVTVAHTAGRALVVAADRHFNCGRWRRPPYYSLSDAELDVLRAGLKTIGKVTPRCGS